jgi:hypothetical protein
LNAKEQKEEYEQEGLDMHISNKQHVNDCEADFCINFLSIFIVMKMNLLIMNLNKRVVMSIFKKVSNMIKNKFLYLYI